MLKPMSVKDRWERKKSMEVGVRDDSQDDEQVSQDSDQVPGQEQVE